MITTFCHRKNYLGVSFLVWKRESTWFWLIINPDGQGGAIGATTNERHATREARQSIEELRQAA